VGESQRMTPDPDGDDGEMSRPTVSVVMSVYNGERYLPEAVESILNQTLQDFEFIVIDDGSTDRTPDILRSYPELEVVSQPNAGLTPSLNRGFRLAQGRYIARMDADDVALPTRFERQVAYLDAHPQVGLLGTAYYQIDDQGKILRQVVMPCSDHELRLALARYNPFLHSSIMVRKELAEKLGYYDEDERYKCCEDYEFWIRLARRSQLANLDEALVKWRLHQANVTTRDDDHKLRGDVRLRSRVIREQGLPLHYWFYVLKPWLALRLPPGVRNWFRRTLLRRTW
jgi:GT2 family glycosyltransferase